MDSFLQNTENSHLTTIYSPNIPLSASSSPVLPLDSLSSTLPYIPPHPQNGTPYHRYTVLLLAQSDNAPLALNEHEIERLDFDTRDFVAQHKLEAKGVSFFRQKWDKSVSKIYEEILRKHESFLFFCFSA